MAASGPAPVQPPMPAAAPAAPAASSPFSDSHNTPVQAAASVMQAPPPSWEETGLTVLAVAIVAAIAALLIRKVIIGFSGYAATSHSSFL